MTSETERAHHPDCPVNYYRDMPIRCRCMWLAMLDQPNLSMTDEQFQHAQVVIGRNVDLAARKDASGRSSMPILVDDLLLLVGLAMHALTTTHPTDQGQRQRQDAGAEGEL